MLSRDNPDFLESKREEMFARFKEKTYVCCLSDDDDDTKSSDSPHTPPHSFA